MIQLQKIIEDDKVYLDNLSFSSFSRMMEAAKGTNKPVSKGPISN